MRSTGAHLLSLSTSIRSQFDREPVQVSVSFADAFLVVINQRRGVIFYQMRSAKASSSSRRSSSWLLKSARETMPKTRHFSTTGM